MNATGNYAVAKRRLQLKRNEAIHQFKDASALTPYEQKINEMRLLGKTSREIVEALGLKTKPKNLSSVMATIRQKLELQRAMIEQSHRINW